MIGSLAIMVLTMMFSFDSFSQTTWSTCPLQVNDTVEILSCSTFENLTPSGISTILWHCTTSDEFLLVRYFSSILPIHRSWVVVNLEHVLSFARHPFSRCRFYSMASSKTSRHDAPWCSSPLDFSKCQ